MNIPGLSKVFDDYGQEQFRAGVEAMRDALLKYADPFETSYSLNIKKEAENLLAEQEQPQK